MRGGDAIDHPPQPRFLERTVSNVRFVFRDMQSAKRRGMACHRRSYCRMPVEHC